MKKLTYYAVLEPADEGGYSVYFPDLPGCTSRGETLAAAREKAAGALGLHICGTEKDGEKLPPPSAAPHIDTQTDKGYIVTPITVFPEMIKNELDSRKVKTNVTLPAWLKEEAEKKSVNFSKLLEEALKDYLNLNS